MKKLVIGKVTRITKDDLIVWVNQTSFKCNTKHISDYNCTLDSMFGANKGYKSQSRG